MFSAFVFLGDNGYWPKNGPVPRRPVNGYGIERFMYKMVTVYEPAVGKED